MSRYLSAITVLATGALALSACGSSSTSASSSASPSAGGLAHVHVTLGAGDTCQVDTANLTAGPVQFHIANTGATAITEVELMAGNRVLAEKENVAPGLPESDFTLTLDGGSYLLFCPGGDPSKHTITVTGKASAAATEGPAALLTEGAKHYSDYVQGQVDSMVAGVKTLREKVQAGDVVGAQQAYAAARPFYERVESDVEGFVMKGFAPEDNKGNLDYLIDMRASNLDPAVGWTGFHAVERDLFQAKVVTAQTKKYADDLVTNVEKLAAVAKGLTFKPEDLANGAAGLLEEVQLGKVSGEEDEFSHLDLVDLVANVEGAKIAFEDLKAGLAVINPTLTQTIDERFTSVEALLATYRDPSALGGYKAYTSAFRGAEASKISKAIQGLQDPMAQIAEKVATA